MTTHNRDKIIAAANEADFTDKQWEVMTYETGPYDITEATTELGRFYAIAFEDGRQAELEDAERYRFLRGYMASERTDLDDEFVSACSTNEPEILDEFIDSSIRARGDNK